jgi:protein-arginine kinase activator protein McsA
MVDEILQEGETVEIESGATDGYTELTIDELNKELEKAVASEDYEKAAKLRDEISKRN